LSWFCFFYFFKIFSKSFKSKYIAFFKKEATTHVRKTKNRQYQEKFLNKSIFPSSK